MPIKNATDTTATIHGVNGHRPSIVPTTILSRGDAELLRDYKVFLAARQLEERLFCPECFQTSAEGTRIVLADKQVAILCAHAMRFYQGPLAPASRFDDLLLATGPDRPLALPDAGLTLTDATPEETLDRTEATLLRTYRAFLVRSGLREALSCSTCWANGDADGCRAYVTPKTIGITCRHRRLTFSGETL